jgi:hypothetical protein
MRRQTRPGTIVLHPIEYEAHEMNEVGKNGIRLERIRETGDWDSAGNDDIEDAKYQF